MQVTTLLSVHHRNLTSLVGYLNEGTHLGLVYEYMANGSLGQCLSGKLPAFSKDLKQVVLKILDPFQFKRMKI